MHLMDVKKKKATLNHCKLLIKPQKLIWGFHTKFSRGNEF